MFRLLGIEMSLSQVKQVAKDNNIKNVSHLNRRELIDLLPSRGIEIPAREPRVRRTTVETPIQEPVATKYYSRLRTIRTNPRRVRLTDVTIGEIREYPSLYSAGKALNHSSKTINDYSGKVYKGKYQIEILPTEAIQTIIIDDRGNEET